MHLVRARSQLTDGNHARPRGAHQTGGVMSKRVRRAISGSNFRRHISALAEPLEQRVLLASLNWTGAVGSDWSTFGNFLNGIAPQIPKAGDSLFFGNTVGSHFANNDLPAGTNFAQIRISGTTSYTLSGNSFSTPLL